MYTLTKTFIASTSVPQKNTFSEIKEKLATGEKDLIMDAFHSVSARGLQDREKAQIFPHVLSLIGHDSIEVKCAAYSFVLRTVKGDPSLLVLAVNTVMQEIKEDFAQTTPSSALKVSLAFDFVSKISDADFLNHFAHRIEKSYTARSDIVRKSALLAAPALFKAFKETKIESIKESLHEPSPVVLGAAISAIISIEKNAKNTFTESELVFCFRVLCRNRQNIEESYGNFALLFTDLCRILRGFSNDEVMEMAALSMEFLPLFALKELSDVDSKSFSPLVAERIASGLISYMGTPCKTDALESILHLLRVQNVKLEVDPFLINCEDTKKEKIFKLHILSLLGSNEGFSEMVSLVRDRECAFHAVCLLLKTGALEDEHILTGFQHSPTSMLRAIYTEHPLPEKFSSVIASILAEMSNVFEKEAFLFLSGYYLSSVPEEANRIKKIRGYSDRALYGKEEEKEKSEEHLEEYLYFLLNMYTRGIISKEECTQEAQMTFAEEPFLFSKFAHLIDLPDRKHLLDLIAYKRVLHKISRIP
ncbi:hypothetical protein NEMIN01_1294 [Nematocida minor]|uniref:uncharacterized protein n=1 Tax=Nematocida minor TaxID=1912983 RepID=UPI00221F74BB|nr:uncharacterized protein NEMIN01_1294 [Nematocida minor]KAI5190961.1 hypothetical protein NEMIN01_1294 [Nematocida minor]